MFEYKLVYEKTGSNSLGIFKSVHNACFPFFETVDKKKLLQDTYY